MDSILKTETREVREDTDLKALPVTSLIRRTVDLEHVGTILCRAEVFLEGGQFPTLTGVEPVIGVEP
jgi:hypothetical protein